MPLDLENIQSGYNLTAINENFQRIEDTWDEKLDRLSSSQGNQMEQDLDMNSNRILNIYTDPDDEESILTVGAGKALFLEHEGDETKTGNLTLTKGLNMSNTHITNIPDATDPSHALPYGQASEVVDDKLTEYDENAYRDYGLVTGEVDDELDYGGI